MRQLLGSLLVCVGLAGSLDAASVGGPTSPDGVELLCDLPSEFHRKNTASHGLGLCVFTSIHHAAMWQDVPQLQEFPKWVIDSNIPGGAYPQKIADLIPKICKSRGMTEPDWIQVESNDLEVLQLACKTGRMPSVTYCSSPTKRYNGGTISHMVSLVHACPKWFVVLDNNYVTPAGKAFEWMSPEEFLRTYSCGRAGWAVILLSAPPPPPPRP
jgi:hypothetical protein